MSYLVSATTAYACMSFCWLLPPVEFITNGILRLLFFVEVEAWWKVWLHSPDSMFLPLTKHMASCASICYHKLYTGYKNAKNDCTSEMDADQHLHIVGISANKPHWISSMIESKICIAWPLVFGGSRQGILHFAWNI